MAVQQVPVQLAVLDVGPTVAVSMQAKAGSRPLVEMAAEPVEEPAVQWPGQMEEARDRAVPVVPAAAVVGHRPRMVVAVVWAEAVAELAPVTRELAAGVALPQAAMDRVLGVVIGAVAAQPSLASQEGATAEAAAVEIIRAEAAGAVAMVAAVAAEQVAAEVAVTASYQLSRELLIQMV